MILEKCFSQQIQDQQVGVLQRRQQQRRQQQRRQQHQKVFNGSPNNSNGDFGLVINTLNPAFFHSIITPPCTLQQNCTSTIRASVRNDTVNVTICKQHYGHESSI